jgi:hypothetical protein
MATREEIQREIYRLVAAYETSLACHNYDNDHDGAVGRPVTFANLCFLQERIADLARVLEHYRQ